MLGSFEGDITNALTALQEDWLLSGDIAEEGPQGGESIIASLRAVAARCFEVIEKSHNERRVEVLQG